MAEAVVKRRGHGEDGIYFAADKNRYVGAVSLGVGRTGAGLSTLKVQSRTGVRVAVATSAGHASGQAARPTLAVCSADEVRTGSGGLPVKRYQPMTLAGLAVRLARTADVTVRWKLVWEFLEEYRWAPADAQLPLLSDEPAPTGDERWDTLLAALAEHLAAAHDAAPPSWADLRVLRRPWFPAELEIQRAEALVWAPAAFRKHGVYLSARDLEAA